jgi:hypothetical protein|tara:strand:- start:4 stop:795 length:792 start_codon:yes stop_codon:yes gene_type:complete
MSDHSKANNKTVSTYKRDPENGLLTNVEYIFNEDGTVNWRGMVKDEFLYPNHDFFNRKGKDSPSSVEGLEDRQLLIMLGGIKELAQLRGFTSITFNTEMVNSLHAVSTCSISWLPNYETGGKEVFSEAVASAHCNNTDEFGMKFLESMSSNRSFVRCVRNFLNIHIVGSDEIDRSRGNAGSGGTAADTNAATVASPTTPNGVLVNTLSLKGISGFDDFKVWLRGLWKSEKYQNEEAKDWKDFKDIPSKEARRLLPLAHAIQNG